MNHQATLTSASVLFLLAALLMPSDPAEAQTRSLVAWDEATTFEVPGTLGALLSGMPGSPLRAAEGSQTLSLEGGVLRQDDGRTSMVIDLDQRVILNVDHESRTYMRFTFGEAGQMAAGMSEMMENSLKEMEQDEELREAMAQRDEAMEELQRAREESSVEMDFRIATDAPGRSQSVGDGVTARQHFVVAELEVTEEIEGADAEEGGILTILVELWQSDDFPDAEAIYEEWARQVGDDAELQAMATEMSAQFESGSRDGAEALATWDPRIAAGMLQIAEAVDEFEGTTVRSITTVALVPSSVEFSRDDLMAWEPESMGSRLAGQAGGAAVDAARGAIRGMFGGRGGGDPEPEEEPATIHPLLRMTSVKSNIRHDQEAAPFVAAMYEELAGYRQIDLGELMERIQSEGEGG